jgi:hypothetical protein
MAIETTVISQTFRVETVKGEWFHVDATFDPEWKTWSLAVAINDCDAKTPDEGLDSIAEAAERLASALKARAR